MKGLIESEASFQRAVVDLARLHGWKTAHFPRVKTSRGVHMTAVAADGAGWPDLTLVRDRILFRELKGPRGRVTPEQAEWGVALTAGGGDWGVWRPADWDRIVATLTGGRT